MQGVQPSAMNSNYDQMSMSAMAQPASPLANEMMGQQMPLSPTTPTSIGGMPSTPTSISQQQQQYQTDNRPSSSFSQPEPPRQRRTSMPGGISADQQRQMAQQAGASGMSSPKAGRPPSFGMPNSGLCTFILFYHLFFVTFCLFSLLPFCSSILLFFFVFCFISSSF